MSFYLHFLIILSHNFSRAFLFFQKSSDVALHVLLHATCLLPQSGPPTWAWGPQFLLAIHPQNGTPAINTVNRDRGESVSLFILIFLKVKHKTQSYSAIAYLVDCNAFPLPLLAKCKTGPFLLQAEETGRQGALRCAAVENMEKGSSLI